MVEQDTRHGAQLSDALNDARQRALAELPRGVVDRIVRRVTNTDDNPLEVAAFNSSI